MEKRIVVIGAGISGLATAYWLEKSGFEVALLEAKGEPGGAMETQIEDGFLIDFGPNSGLETTPLISQLAEEVGIKDEMIYANEEG
ncbi:MAG: FAD-dependent oxidoreductase, partial [Bacteroidota bacterium]